MSNQDTFIKIEFPEHKLPQHWRTERELLHLHIKDFPHRGINFKSYIKSWDFENPFSRGSASSQIRKPLIVTRTRDENSHVFATMEFQYRRVGDGVTKLKLPEVTLVGDNITTRSGNKTNLLKRYIFYFTDCDVVDYNIRSDEETIHFDFEKGWTFDSPGVIRTGP